MSLESLSAISGMRSQAPRFDELVQVALQRAAVGLVALAPLVFLVVNVSWPVVGLGPLADWTGHKLPLADTKASPV